VNTFEFASLFDAKSKVETEVLDAKHKINLIETEREKYKLARIE